MVRVSRQRGWTLMEALVVIALIAIVAAIAIPQVTGSKKTVANGEAYGNLASAYESAQEYFAGEENDYGNLTFVGFTPAKAQAIDPTFHWTTGTLSGTDPKQIRIHQFPLAGELRDTTPGEQALVLCSASKQYTYCLANSTGTMWGAASGINPTQAATRAVSSPCAKPELAEDGAC